MTASSLYSTLDLNALPLALEMSLAQRLDKDLNKTGSCWLWPKGIQRDGYGMIGGRYNGVFYQFLAHRVAFVLAKGAIPPGLFVLHHCDTPACCNPLHLYAGTHEDNMRDRTKRDRMPKGDEHWIRKNPEKCVRGVDVNTAILAPDDIKNICRLRYENRASYRSLAQMFGVSSDQIRRICLGLSWRHLGYADKTQSMESFRPSKSGIPGVHWCEYTKKWRARVSDGERQRDLGRFATIEDAVEAIKRYTNE